MPWPKGLFMPIWPRLLAHRAIEDECWIWTGACSPAGYGRVSYHGTGNCYVHRVAYELAKGVIPDGMQIDHLCRRRDCFNPEHLEAVTSRENTLRGDNPWAVIVRSGRCRAGHEMTPENTYLRPDGKGRQCRTCAHLRYVRRRDAAQVM